jgi:hypothetical protein
MNPRADADVRAAWRNRGDDPTTTRIADTLAVDWQKKDALPPRADQAGWDASEEAHLLHGLDRLLMRCHPDLSYGPAGFGHAAADRLTARYRAHGYWYRDRDILLLPRRATPCGPRLRLADIGPLAHTCAVRGELAQAIQIRRLPPEIEADPADAPALDVAECAVSPLVGSDAFELAFEQNAGRRWTYGPRLDDTAISDELLERVLTAAEANKVTLLALPEYCCSPELVARWQALLRRRPLRTLRWILLGSGPVPGAQENAGAQEDENVATLVSYDGQFSVWQGKAQPYDLTANSLAGWSCPNVPADAADRTIQERIRPHAEWSIVECNRGRIAVCICESIRPETDRTLVAALGQASPTLLLCPIFDKPTDPRRSWLRETSAYWADKGVQVLVANSFVVAGWQAAADGGSLPPRITCAAARTLDDSPKGHTWATFDATLAPSANGTSDAVVSIR